MSRVVGDKICKIIQFQEGGPCRQCDSNIRSVNLSGGGGVCYWGKIKCHF